MPRTDLLFLAQVAATPIPPEDHPQYGTLLQAKANAEIERRSLRASAEASLYVFCRDVLGYADLYEPLHRPLCVERLKALAGGDANSRAPPRPEDFGRPALV